ncbi:hypothetical protein J6X13_01620 [Candidatus Saccharibacteria bacterium]|nr:hypothetical protein [Candidatus Saccharibacteria bacterium]
MVLSWKKLTNHTIWSAYKRCHNYVKAAHMNGEKDLLDAFRIIVDYEEKKNTQRWQRDFRHYRYRVSMTRQKDFYLAAYHDILDEIRFCYRDPDRFKHEGQAAFEAFLYILEFMSTRWPERKGKIESYMDAVISMTRIDDRAYIIAEAEKARREILAKAQKVAGRHVTVERKVRNISVWIKESIDE